MRPEESRIDCSWRMAEQSREEPRLVREVEESRKRIFSSSRSSSGAGCEQ